MKNFISIVFENKDAPEVDEYLIDTVLESAEPGLLEDLTDYESYETEGDKTVVTVGLHKALSEDESHEVANLLANKLFDLGYNNFHIELHIAYIDKYL